MNKSLITVRYAKALFELVEEKQLVEQIKEEMEVLLHLTEESREFALLLESPVIATAKKIEALKTLFNGKLHDYTLKMLQLATENKRESYLPAISRHFLTLYFKAKGIRQATITLPSESTEEATQQLQETLEQKLNMPIELKTKINPAIIGGMILRIDDLQLDGSVSGKLQRIKSHLKKTEIVK
ncbi:ATP synthase F1 subunit delta [Prolixibacteraceae bacterium JC049]|nr:ATP synthase F1 subunit delta [Prolixibacteraceae bacterium JC049]